MKHGVGRRSAIGWWSGAGLWLAVGCSATNPAYDVVSTSGGSGGTAGGSSDSAMTAAETAQTSAMSGSAESGTGPGSGTSLDGSTGPEVCESAPLHPEDYPRCNEGLCEGADCIEFDSPEPVEYVLSACATSCVEDCDCPAPSADRAQPSCDEGLCALDCSDGRPCPGSMVCAEGLCLRVDAYGPCGGSCLSGYCFGFVEMGMFTDWVCPVVDCLDGEIPDDDLCPPPPDGNAIPRCFEPQNPPKLQGTGWCVLTCPGGETCPEGMECLDGDCLHAV